MKAALADGATRRRLLAGSVAALSVGLSKKVFASPDLARTMTPSDMAGIGASQQGGRLADAIRAFRLNVPEAKLRELRRRIKATNWPERETVTDESQGVQLATMQGLARYWGTDYDWRKCEARLNALPQFMTEIDGLDIHFIHARSKHENALPLIVTHG
jgi:hypothetical protein